MTRLLLLSAALFAAVPVAAQNQPQTEPGASADAPPPNPQLKTLLENCDAHKFETMVDTVLDGQPHRSKVKMCGKEGQTDSDWIQTLEDAIAKLESNKEMEPAVREQVVTAVKAEVARLKGASTGVAPSEFSLTPRQRATQAPISDDYTVLPALPPRKSPLPPPASNADVGTADSTAASVAPPAKAVTPPLVPVAKPRLTISCMDPQYPGGADCVSLSRDTVLNVRAGEALPAGVLLRFLRNGQARGEIALGAMRNGRSVNFSLPREVCAGVVSAEVEMVVVRSGQSVERRGPFLLRC
jgi:hypothetical protein